MSDALPEATLKSRMFYYLKFDRGSAVFKSNSLCVVLPQNSPSESYDSHMLSSNLQALITKVKIKNFLA